MRSFILEGRLSSHTRAAAAADGPFRPAAEAPGLQALFAERDPLASFGLLDPQPDLRPGAARQGQERAGRLAGPEPGGNAAPPRRLLVYAEPPSLAEGEIGGALADIASGSVRLGVGLWLVLCPFDAAGLRNRLTQGRSQDDRLLVVEAPLEAAAWFNLAADEGAVRALWSSSRL